MDFQKQGIIYLLMVMPLFLAGTVIVQGFQKIKKNNPDGKVSVGFGIFFLILIVVVYVVYIK